MTGEPTQAETPEGYQNPMPQVPAMADRYCGARTRNGGYCRRPAGWGTGLNFGRCKLHGGGTMTHGAHSIRTTDPGTQLVADHLAAVLAGEPQAILRPADRQALESAAVLIRQREALERWLNQHGPVDEKGNTRPAVEALVKVNRGLLEFLRELGMTPAARAKLGLDVVRGFDLARAMAVIDGERTDSESEGLR